MPPDAIRPSTTRALDRLDDATPQDHPGPETAHRSEFDFAGAAYAAIHLPHGLLAGATPTRPTFATVAKDLTDFEGKMRRLEHDLASPGMREWLSKHVEATKTGLSIGWKLAAVALTIALFKEKGAALLLSTDGMLKLVSGGDKMFGLVGDCKTFARQLGEEHAAARAAHPDVVRIEHDLAELTSAGAKLAVDLRKLGGT